MVSDSVVAYLLCALFVAKSFHFGTAMEAERVEGAIPVTGQYSPPEGNTTFLEGTTWCVAAAGASQIDLQKALDWACGLGMAECKEIQVEGACFHPNNLVSHASYAFNSYYQQNGNSDIACNFGGTAILTKHDPSYGKCTYAASAGRSVGWGVELRAEVGIWCKCAVIVLLLFYLETT
ncbi:Glucan endo-1,3-beta-glucosidase 13 [Linum perenne]